MKLMRMIAIAALLASSHLVYGQDETDVMSANIPFAFTANGVAMPAGQYVVSQVRANWLWKIRTPGHMVYLTATPRELKQVSQTSRLIFSHEGTSYTLLQLQQQAQKGAVEVAAPDRAKERRSPGQQIATVTVPAR